MSFWSSKRIVVTGGAGFLGSHVVERLRQHDCEVLVPRKQEYDLTFLEAALQYFEETKPNIVIHSAAFTEAFGLTNCIQVKFITKILSWGRT